MGHRGARRRRSGLRMTLLAVALTAVSLFGCSSNQVQDHQHPTLVYGRDWRLPSPESTPVLEISVTSALGAAIPAERPFKLSVGLNVPRAIEITPTVTVIPATPAPILVPSPPPSRISSGSLSAESLRAVLVSTGWPEGLLSQAMAISWCESNWQPGARNASGAAGLFQEMPPWAPHFGYSYDQLFDPYVNASIALQLYRQYGWGPWVCSV